MCQFIIKPVMTLTDSVKNLQDPGKEEMITDGAGNLTEEQIEALLGEDTEDGSGLMNEKSSDTEAKKPSRLSGTQLKRRAICRQLISKGKMQGFQVENRKVIPTPNPGQTREEAEKLIVEHRKPKSTNNEAADGQVTKRLRTPTDPNSKVKRVKRESKKLDDTGLILAYQDNFSEKICEQAFRSFQQTLDAKLSDALLKPLAPTYQIERTVLLRNGHILISCVNEITRLFVTNLCQTFTWKGPSGPKTFKAWPSNVDKDNGDLLKMVVRVSGPKRNMSDFFAMLERQNPGICTKNWKDCNNGPEDMSRDFQDNHILFIGVDPASAELIKANNNSLFYSTKRVQFHLYVENKEQGEASKKAATVPSQELMQD